MFEGFRYLIWILIIVVGVAAFRLLGNAKNHLCNDLKRLDESNNKHKKELDELKKEYEQKYQKAVELEEEHYSECMDKLDEILRRLEK